MLEHEIIAISPNKHAFHPYIGGLKTYNLKINKRNDYEI